MIEVDVMCRAFFLASASSREKHADQQTNSKGKRQRRRACNPAASHSLHSGRFWGHFERHSEFAILGSFYLAACQAAAM